MNESKEENVWGYHKWPGKVIEKHSVLPQIGDLFFWNNWLLLFDKYSFHSFPSGREKEEYYCEAGEDKSVEVKIDEWFSCGYVKNADKSHKKYQAHDQPHYLEPSKRNEFAVAYIVVVFFAVLPQKYF